MQTPSIVDDAAQRLDREGARSTAATYKPPVVTAPTNDNEMWRSITNGYTTIFVKNPAGGTRTYVEKNVVFYAMESANADGL